MSAFILQLENQDRLGRGRIWIPEPCDWPVSCAKPVCRTLQGHMGGWLPGADCCLRSRSVLGRHEFRWAWQSSRLVSTPGSSLYGAGCMCLHLCFPSFSTEVAQSAGAGALQISSNHTAFPGSKLCAFHPWSIQETANKWICLPTSMPSPFAVLVQSPYLLCCKHDEVWIQLVVDVQLAWACSNDAK